MMPSIVRPNFDLEIGFSGKINIQQKPNTHISAITITKQHKTEKKCIYSVSPALMNPLSHSQSTDFSRRF
jgi:hypothetical protein